MAASNGSVEAEKITSNMTPEERHAAVNAAKFGYGPLSHVKSGELALLPAFGGEFQPGLYRSVEKRKFGNPAPLGLSAFALTTFVLSLINVGARSLTAPNIVVALAFGYGGLVQLVAGMWEFVVGNTFGGTALSSYGGFWFAFAIILTPGGFDIVASIEKADGAIGFLNGFALFLLGWFIFTTILLLCTLKSNLAFFLLFFCLDITFLLLTIAYFNSDGEGPNSDLQKAAGGFGVATSIIAWYNAMAGIADNSNSFFILPVFHFPWSEKARAAKPTSQA